MGPKNFFFDPKGGPFYFGDKNFFEIEIELKKNFDSDLDETQNF